MIQKLNIKKSNECNIEAAEIEFLRMILKISWIEKPINQKNSNKRFKYVGHTLCNIIKPDDNTSHKKDSQRKRGRPTALFARTTVGMMLGMWQKIDKSCG